MQDEQGRGLVVEPQVQDGQESERGIALEAGGDQEGMEQSQRVTGGGTGGREETQAR